MEYIIGIILLITFVALSYYCLKGHNLMIGFLVMTVLWTALPLSANLLFANGIIDNPEFIANNPEVITSVVKQADGTGGLLATLNEIFQTATEGWGTTLVNVCWGAWFGRVLMETGIAATLIRKTVELGGNKPIITVILLNIVTSIIFTSMAGPGPVIAIGVIILPILFSLGIPKAVALFSFTGSVASGVYLNPVNFAQFRIFFTEADDHTSLFDYAEYTKVWGIWALLLSLLITCIFTAYFLKREKSHRAWAAQTESSPKPSSMVPSIALIVPILPVCGAIFLGLSVIFGFVFSGFLALFLCGKLKGTFKEVCGFINKMYYDGVVDTAPLIGFLLTVPMFSKAAALCAPYFKAVLGNLIPQSSLILCIIFAAISCFGLFRGPMTLMGCGAATLGVVKHMGFGLRFLYGCFTIPTVTMNMGSCITQSWIAWGLAYSKIESKDYLRMSIVNGYVVSIILYAFTYLLFG